MLNTLILPSPTNQGGPGGRLIVGETAPAFVGVQYLGVWNSQEEIDESGILNQMVGGPRFKDTDGDKVISINDFEVIGSPEADFLWWYSEYLQMERLDFGCLL